MVSYGLGFLICCITVFFSKGSFGLSLTSFAIPLRITLGLEAPEESLSKRQGHSCKDEPNGHFSIWGFWWPSMARSAARGMDGIAMDSPLFFRQSHRFWMILVAKACFQGRLILQGVDSGFGTVQAHAWQGHLWTLDQSLVWLNRSSLWYLLNHATSCS